MADLDVKQIYDANPSTTLANDDLLYVGQTPYGAADDSAIKYSDLADQLSGSLVMPYTAIFVNENGNDITGNGSLLTPYKTVNAAMAAISDAAITKQYVINMSGSITDTTVTLKPYIHLFSDGSPWYVTTINLDATMNTAENLSCWYQNLSFASTCTANLLFPDVVTEFGWLNFLNCRTTRIDGSATPTIIFNVGSTNGYHHFNFYNCIWGEHNDGDDVSIICNSGDQAPLNINGGTTCRIIDYNSCTGGWMVIQAAQVSGSGTIMTLNSISLYINNVLNNYGSFSIECLDNNSINYDCSIQPANFIITGSGNAFTPITTSLSIFSSYVPSNFAYPSPVFFGTEPTVYDAIEGIDTKLGTLSTPLYPPYYVWGFDLIFSGLTTVSVGNVFGGGSCLDSTLSYNITTPYGLNLDFSTNGAGGLDTGSFAANTKYAIYAIAKSSVPGGDVDVIGSTNFAAPDLSFDPTYNKYRYIGFIRTLVGAAQIVGFSCRGTSNERTYYLASADTSLNVLSGGSATSFTNVDCSAYKNANYTQAIGFTYTLNPGTETTNVAYLLGNSLGNPFWTRTPGVASIVEIGSTGLISYNDNGALIGYYFSSGTSTGRSLSLTINMVQEYI